MSQLYIVEVGNHDDDDRSIEGHKWVAIPVIPVHAKALPRLFNG
jgi:hypothetical protein